ncbi:alpha-1,6-glucosidase domain-containing protein [Massilia sp. CF038]|uniref:alpha-1,6-glucosidase domain-containing protein n=1 Tax=Massilia sp. CF038 TaxID=1881045 RepID=UPI00091F743D|nr:alpha-1,6-glucosidase domain-containing protein [Massilia sp. CF038]SHG41442.1 alpha-1,6-glucosidases, pullulanase-type [Massilia sp. CF038]
MRFAPSFAALTLAAAALPGSAAVSLDACNATDFQTVLQPNTAPQPARAVWLDRYALKWPGASASGSFKLYHSPLGSITVANGRIDGAAGSLPLTSGAASTPSRFHFVGAGPVLRVPSIDTERLRALHREQLVLVQEAADGSVIGATRIQVAGALDDLYGAASRTPDLGATPGARGTSFKLWAPSAQQVAVCIYEGPDTPAVAVTALQSERATGIWQARDARNLSGRYYRYLVDVIADGTGLVRNHVTDPYSVSLSTDSKRSYIADLAEPRLKPKGWDQHQTPNRVSAQTDMVVYELHVRDFSINDNTVAPSRRGKYAAFGEAASNGMRHLSALSSAGMTDIHLLPVYDIATVPEHDCAVPSPAGAPDSDAQQALVMANAGNDCFNWGYDPYHYSAPEGSYASDAADGARRIIEFREMVMNLHRAGLRVGMDVVYNHTFAAGQKERSVLDRIVPGYYHRLDADGKVAQSTCCDNTATENRMMEKLMIDSVALWTRHYRIDSFRFDLMGHQPRAAMERLQARVNRAAGKQVNLIGEGWNFGEVENGARFVQASQLSLNGSGIGTFSDRARDSVRGGGASDSGLDMFKRQGYINGLVYDANAYAGERPAADLLAAADMVKVGLAGSVRSYRMATQDGTIKRLDAIDYSGQPAGYASEPGEAVNYVENHDNQTLYDMNVFKLPLETSSAERARVQILAAAINAFSQGVAYFHAGIDTLRSKSLDRNSFNSGDWFNRIDWSYQDNYFGTGLPPAADNGKDYALLKPLLANAALKPAPADIAFARDAFRDLLRIRASSTLFRLRTAADINARLRFYNTGPQQVPTIVAARIDGKGYRGANFSAVNYFINVDKEARSIAIDASAAARMRLHPAHQADPRAAQAHYDHATGMMHIPARTAVVFVE